MSVGRSSRPVAVVTGAGSADGIGFACARQLAEDHAVVIASTTARIHERVQQLGGEGSGVVGFVGDLTASATAGALVALALEAFGRIDVLVNNAGLAAVSGTGQAASVTSITDEDWQGASRAIWTRPSTSRGRLFLSSPTARGGSSTCRRYRAR